MNNQNDTFWIRPKSISRRTALKGAGVCLALPFLNSMAADKNSVKLPESDGKPRRMISILVDQGIVPWYFFPEEKGKNYKNTKYLELLKDHKEDMTVFSGVALPDVDGGHHADIAWLTGAAHPSRGGFKNSVSLDQVAAEHIGQATRFPTISMKCQRKTGISCTRSGVLLPGEDNAAALYEKMFMKGKPAEINALRAKLQEGRSILDTLIAQSKSFSQKIGKDDKEKLAQYQNSVREAELRLQKMQAWEKVPKPKVDQAQPKGYKDKKDIFETSPALLDMAKLAFMTDSSRLITLIIGGNSWHPVTHHGKRDEKLKELAGYETQQFQILNKFLSDLKAHNEDGDTLLDRTMVLYGTNMGDANKHSNDNLPTLLAGGGFKHNGHMVFDKKNNYPLTNLHLSMLHRLGIQIDRFSSSTGTMTGLEMV